MIFDINGKEIISAIKKGDKSAYKKVYLAYYNLLCKYIYSLSPNYKEAEDLVQETLLDLWIKREKIIINKSLNNYLYRCAYNKFINHHRKTKRSELLLDQLYIEAIIELEGLENEDKESRLIAIENAIELLPPKRKDIFKLSKLNNYKYKEIAIMRNITVSTVETHIRKAMITIREQMKNPTKES
ncbi:RNA polymerase sigma factor [Aestuariivivens sp. NBU2969]|uniref:RNA polymerase sigma factor n=1 Tax=Aestuariivivens sp. NBU2969 TaxID=2873267 RepID=UPI001CBE5472|nr:sigma-70 family RNA polymerase sigma factor [Aestuariivivens sp. NBU2969]